MVTTMKKSKDMLTPEQLALCTTLYASFVNAAKEVPIRKFYASIQFLGAAFVFLFECALFFGIFSYMQETADYAISSNMQGLASIVMLLTAHIICIEYKKSCFF